MQIVKSSKSPTRVELVISGDIADLVPIKQHVLRHFASRVKIPGFRPGKAPLEMVERHADQKLLLDEFIEQAINSLYNRALQQESLRGASQPTVALKKFVPFSTLEFSAELDIIGELKLPDHTKIKLPKKPVQVGARDVEEVITSLRQRLAERREVARGVAKGDEVIIDFNGRDDNGQLVSGTEAKDYPLLLGGGAFIPGFEDNLIGSKAGDHKQFNVTLPGDYGVQTMQGKKVTFEVIVKKVQELVVAKADDSFAAKAGPFKTLAQLKADIKKQLMIERQRQADSDYQNELVKTIVEGAIVDLPDGLIDEQLLHMEEEEKRNITYRGQTWEEHLAQEGITEKQHRDRHRPDARQRVKVGLVLSEIAAKEKIEVTSEELEIRHQILKGQYKDPGMQVELDKPENQRELANQLLIEKTLSRLVEHATKK